MAQLINKLCIYCGGNMTEEEDFSEITGGTEKVYFCDRCGSMLIEEEGEYARKTCYWSPSDEAEECGDYQALLAKQEQLAKVAFKSQNSITDNDIEDVLDKDDIIVIVKTAIANNCEIKELHGEIENLCLYDDDVDHIAEQVAYDIIEKFQGYKFSKEG